jgi:hypothetical protein
LKIDRKRSLITWPPRSPDFISSCGVVSEVPCMDVLGRWASLMNSERMTEAAETISAEVERCVRDKTFTCYMPVVPRRGNMW